MVAELTRLAANQRRMRVAARLSQAELAAAAGVTTTTVAAVEQGRANPRLETLSAIAGALGVALPELLAAPAGPPVEVVRAGRDASLVRDGYRLETQQVPAGHEAELPAEPGGERLVVVLTGRLTTGPVEAPTELDAGDSAAFPATTPALLRTGRRGARALVLTTRA